MKVAEALLIRSELSGKVSSLRYRIRKNAVVQEGDAPDEDPGTLIDAAFVLLEEQEILACRINRTNVNTLLPDGNTMMEALAKLDGLKIQLAVLTRTIERAKGSRGERYSRQEIKWVKVVDVHTLQKQADRLAMQIRKLNARIQEENWKMELED